MLRAETGGVSTLPTPIQSHLKRKSQSSMLPLNFLVLGTAVFTNDQLRKVLETTTEDIQNEAGDLQVCKPDNLSWSPRPHVADGELSSGLHKLTEYTCPPVVPIGTLPT